ncbi:glucuronate isomerase [Paenibacillus sp. GYB003]|uniref:glucuronate isomerase n=1 Tax=Paenibacillus sp. GYB003 TaxID=2994392 RepID=UPI002F96AB42
MNEQTNETRDTRETPETSETSEIPGTRETSARKSEFTERIMRLPVLDTHTHLVGDRLCARDFWEIADYFWLKRELEAGGYPPHAAELPEEERIRAFLDAYRATRNTLMNRVFTQIFNQLYGIDITDEASVREADAAVKRSSRSPNRAQDVADRLNVRRFVVNVAEHADFRGMRDNAVLIPRIDGKLGGWVRDIAEAGDPAAAFARTRETIKALIAQYRDDGCPGIMTTLPRYDSSAHEKKHVGPGIGRDDILMLLLHEIAGEAERRGMLVQLFLGVERSWCGTAVPANDTARILKLSALFETYKCPFELVVASELNNLDVVQAAWNFPNVSVGGLWWFNFRASTYRDAMQYRFEALPALKSSLIVSDARCIEWSYGKIWLVKRLLADFLWKQTEEGWIDREAALQVAEDWLYRSASARYGAS